MIHIRREEHRRHARNMKAEEVHALCGKVSQLQHGDSRWSAWGRGSGNGGCNDAGMDPTDQYDCAEGDCGHEEMAIVKGDGKGE